MWALYSSPGPAPPRHAFLVLHGLKFQYGGGFSGEFKMAEDLKMNFKMGACLEMNLKTIKFHRNLTDAVLLVGGGIRNYFHDVSFLGI
jgi:hypothetical protein